MKQVYTILPSWEEIKKVKKIKNLDRHTKETYIHKINLLNRKYYDIFIANTQKIMEMRDNFMLGILVALTFNVFILFLSKSLPDNTFSIAIIFFIFLILFSFLSYKLYRLTVVSKASKSAEKDFEFLKQRDFGDLVKQIEQDKSKGDEYLSYFLPFVLKEQENQISLKSHYVYG